jgi:hypothetical protein
MNLKSNNEIVKLNTIVINIEVVDSNIDEMKSKANYKHFLYATIDK